MFKKFTAGVVGSALFLAATLPVFADTTVTVSGNGFDSDNKVEIKKESTTTVAQTSVTNADIDLAVIGNSGKNQASGNTGSDVTIDTGDVTNKVKVGVTGGSNLAYVKCCCCDSGDTTVEVKHNGAKSDNEVKIESECTQTVAQTSVTNADVDAVVVGNSGKNKAKYNTGKWSVVSITTGKVENKVRVKVRGGSNVAL